MKKLAVLLMVAVMLLGVWSVAGATRSSARSRFTTVRRDYNLAPSVSGDHWLVAACRHKRRAIGGGYEVPPDGGVEVWGSVPGGRIWIVKLRKTSTSSTLVRVWAVCR